MTDSANQRSRDNNVNVDFGGNDAASAAAEKLSNAPKISRRAWKRNLKV